MAQRFCIDVESKGLSLKLTLTRKTASKCRTSAMCLGKVCSICAKVFPPKPDRTARTCGCSLAQQAHRPAKGYEMAPALCWTPSHWHKRILWRDSWGFPWSCTEQGPSLLLTSHKIHRKLHFWGSITWLHDSFTLESLYYCSAQMSRQGQIFSEWVTRAFLQPFETTRNSQSDGRLPEGLVLHMNHLKKFPKQKDIVKWPVGATWPCLLLVCLPFAVQNRKKTFPKETSTRTHLPLFLSICKALRFVIIIDATCSNESTRRKHKPVKLAVILNSYFNCVARPASGPLCSANADPLLRNWQVCLNVGMVIVLFFLVRNQSQISVAITILKW